MSFVLSLISDMSNFRVTQNWGPADYFTSISVYVSPGIFGYLVVVIFWYKGKDSKYKFEL